MNAVSRTRPGAASVSVTMLPPPSPRQARTPIDVEELLVWVYRHQRADRVIWQGAGLHDLEAGLDGVERHGGSSLAAVERILRLGMFVDQSGPGNGALHEDAEAVHRVVEAMAVREEGMRRRDLLITYARMADRPDPMVGQIPRPMPIRTVRGAVLMEPNQRHPKVCPLDYQPSWERIWQARSEYNAWHRGLRLVALTLQGVPLKLWRVKPPAAPDTPWLDAGTKP